MNTAPEALARQVIGAQLAAAGWVVQDRADMNRTAQAAVKANVLFFDRATPGTGVATRDLWVYDLRTNQRFTLRERPLRRADLDDFVACYGSKYGRAKRQETERFRRFSY